jgi:UDP-N-acetylglucosamine 1-carboxyvinyltransferase
MGANISYHDRTAMFTGVKELYGSPVKAMDLRAGAAMIIAGLTAHGATEIYDIHHIERGYENIVDKFKALGANIEYEITND